MQFSKIVFVATMAVSSVAALPNSAPGGGSGGAQTCGNGQSQVCCDTVSFLGLTCILSSLLGQTCSTETLCCTNTGTGNQVCTDSTGTVVTVPVTVTVPITVPIIL